jgi:exodeoxyribonuclease VII small subunit
MSEIDTSEKNNLNNLTFKDGLSELENIVNKLESGELELEDSLTAYEHGVALLAALKTKLGEAQQKVTTLMGEVELEVNEDIDGSLS